MRHNLLFFSSDPRLTDRLRTALSHDCTVLAVDLRTGDENALAPRFDPNIIVIDASSHTGARTTLEHIASIRGRFPDLPFVALGDEMSAQLILTAFRGGVDDFLDRDSSDGEIRSAIRSQVTDRVKRGEGGGALVNIFSPTASDEDGDLALNIASIMAAAHGERRVVLVDLSLPASFTRTALGLEFNFMLPAALRDMARLDRTFLDTALARHGDTGLYVLPLAEPGKDAVAPDPRELAVLLEVLRTLFDATVLYWGAYSQQAVQAGLVHGHVFVSCNQRFSSVIGAKTLWGMLSSNVEPVLAIHQFDRTMVPSPQEIADALGARQSVVLRADWSYLASAHNRGRPVVLLPPTPYSEALRMRLIQDGLLSDGARETTTRFLRWLHRARA